MRTDASDILTYAVDSFKNEVWTSRVYDDLSERYRSTDLALADHLAKFAVEEKQHATYWQTFLTNRGIQRDVIINPYRFSFFTLLFRILGIGFTLKMLEIGEREAIQQYSLMLRGPHLSKTEKHGLLRLLEDELQHEEEIEEYESRFELFMKKVATINSQLSNGLVVVLSIATGFSGLFVNPLDIVIPSLIVGITSAFSTMTGFYFFGRTQNVIKKDILARLKMTITTIPHVFTDRVRKYMSEKKIGQDTVNAITREAERNVEYLTQMIAEEEYGIKEAGLSNPLENALYAGLFRIIGTLVPLTPYILGLHTSLAIPISVLITVVMLGITGFFVALAAEVSIKQKIVELILSGVILATIAFGLGRLTAHLRSLL